MAQGSLKAVLTFAACATVLASNAWADPMITNGGFESSTYTSSTEFGPYPGFTNGVTGWTSSLAPSTQGFNVYWFPADVAAGYSAPNRFNDPGDKLPLAVVASPNGGNFVALDGDTAYNGYLYQTISGLIAGQQYVISFDWGGAQLLNRNAPTTDSLSVTLGSAPGVGETHSTGVINVAPQGFSGWMTASMTFTADSVTEVLSFLSVGSPSSLPPVVLLDGVSIQVPEPVSVVVLLAGLFGVGAARRRKRTIA